MCVAYNMCRQATHKSCGKCKRIARRVCVCISYPYSPYVCTFIYFRGHRIVDVSVFLGWLASGLHRRSKRKSDIDIRGLGLVVVEYEETHRLPERSLGPGIRNVLVTHARGMHA